MSEMMITADDYGPVEFINNGIEKALQNSCIDTVSVLMNPHTDDTVNITQQIKKLKLDFPFVHIGIHLSITSGRPVSKPEHVPSLLSNATDFQYLHAFDYEKVQLDELEKELRAQIALFPVDDIPIDHISCHHGILPLFKRFFKLYVDLANEIKVPIRQPIPISKMKVKGFRWSLMKRQGIFTSLRLLNDVDIDNLVDSLKHINKLEDLLKECDVLEVACCKYFVDHFYRRASKKRLKKILRILPKDVLLN